MDRFGGKQLGILTQAVACPPELGACGRELHLQLRALKVLTHIAAASFCPCIWPENGRELLLRADGPLRPQQAHIRWVIRRNHKRDGPPASVRAESQCWWGWWQRSHWRGEGA